MRHYIHILTLFTLIIPFVSCKLSDKTEQQETAEPEKVLSASEIYEAASPSVTMIISYDQNHVPLMQGSGFFVAEDTILTNFHVVAGAYSVEYKIIGEEKVHSGAKIISVTDKFDLAKIATKAKFNSLDTSKEIKVGMPVYAIGNPRGLEGTISEGIVSANRNTEGIDLIQTTAPISPGSSGGPLLDNTGKVVGVATFTFRDSQNLNFAVPVTYADSCNTCYEPTIKSTKIKNVGESDLEITNFYVMHWSVGDCWSKLSVKNNTENTISEIGGIVVFYNNDGTMIDYETFTVDESIYPGLTKQLSLPAGCHRIHPGGYIGTWVFDKKIPYSKSGKSNYFKSGGYPMIEVRFLYYETTED